MAPRFRCIIADHDDTNVDSTPNIHHPIYLELMSEVRPNIIPLDLRGFRGVNNNGGILEHYRNDLEFDEEMLEYAIDFWKSHDLRNLQPPFYEGILEMFDEYRSKGGMIAISSHSDERRIREHFENSASFVPEEIFSSDLPKEMNKPSTYPIDYIVNNYGIRPEEIAVIDDMLPGHEMARKAGSYRLGAGWGIYDEMIEANVDSYFNRVEDCRDFIMND